MGGMKCNGYMVMTTRDSCPLTSETAFCIFVFLDVVAEGFLLDELIKARGLLMVNQGRLLHHLLLGRGDLDLLLGGGQGARMLTLAR